MSYWWKRKLPLYGSVLFRGELPPQPEEFASLEKQGVKITPSSNNSRSRWMLDLEHPEWGKAQIMSTQDAPLPARELFEFAFIPKSDKEAALSTRSAVHLRMDSRHDHVLRDRKLMLRFLRAVMGDDGVVVLDGLSEKVWTREELDDELSHNADLDVEGIYNIHAVRDDDDNPYWIHSHGLAEIGAFDFDIFDASPEVMYGIQDLFRAVAFHILEGSIGPSTQNYPLVYPRGNIRVVDMDYFLTHTDSEHRKRLEPDVADSHKVKHCVLCEPEGSFIGRLFGGKTLQPVRFLTKELPENPIFSFSTPASELMAERARNTYPIFRALHEEFAEFDFGFLVKLGMQTDNGSETDKEHIWFEVNELLDDSIDCTCANQPYHVSGLKEGDRGRYSIDLMSDWTIFTPVGMINPRTTTVARMLRAIPDDIRQKMIKGE